MKKLCCAVLILLAILATTLYNSWYLQTLVSDYTQHLNHVRELADAGNWKQAESETKLVWQQWQEHEFYLYSMLHHDELDQICITMDEVLEYLNLAERDQFNATNTRLITQLNLLAEMERPTLQNIL